MQLRLRNVGQILEAELHFGDLTVLVGPQATGKSIALQFLKLAVDMGYVQDEMTRYGIDWSGKLPDFFDAYFGEGMSGLWTDGASAMWWQGNRVDLDQWIKRKRRGKDESLFLIPAQRVLTMRDGWPRRFTDYSPGDPFAVREFSEKLRNLVEDFGSSESLFPQTRRLKQDFRDMLKAHVFKEFSLGVDKVRAQKRLMLGTKKEALPFMVWSAGQREFVPLLLGLYWLMPPTKISRRGEIEWVVIEELEMGLHPRAVSVLLLMVLELVVRGYRVCLSTHSPQVLETIWALQHLRQNHAHVNDYLELFTAPKSQPMQNLVEGFRDKRFKVYYFDPSQGHTSDISELDPSSDEAGQAIWGGLSEFSGRANEVVAHTAANVKHGTQH